MKLALIPPRGLESRMWEGQCVLALAHLFDDPVYFDNIRRLAAAGRHRPMIMDNGAAEGVKLTAEEINAKVHISGCTEVVLPDVLEDYLATINAVREYCSKYKPIGKRFFAVVQGTTKLDLYNCVNEYADIPQVKVIGLPRHLLGKLAKTARIDLAQWIWEHYQGRFQIHFLGAHPVWVKEAYYANKYVPFVRSMDTSLPYNYAIEGYDLRQKSSWTQVVSRRTSYFNQDWTEIVNTELVRANEEVFLKWTSDTL